jgi:outer membrane protein assembly factor BamB
MLGLPVAIRSFIGYDHYMSNFDNDYKGLTMMNRIAITLILLSGPSLAHAENWPQWRGPNLDGHSAEKGLPISWNANKNIAWKFALPGPGGSTPAVWDDHIFLTSVDEKSDLVVLCVKTDGKLLWKNVGPVSRGPSMKGEGNDASPSPSTDGKHVFAYFGSGDFICYDFDGNEVWKFNAAKRYGKFSIQHGMHVTPLLHEDRLYFALLTNGGHWVIAIDKATGKDIWKVARPTDAVGESREAYTSPVLWKNGEELNLVILGCDYATGHSLKDGAELWRLADLNPGKGNKSNHRIIASPAAAPAEFGGQLVVPTCRGLHVVSLKPGAAGLIKAGSPLEQWRINKGAPDVSVPLVHEGLVYLPQSQHELLVIDLKTGKEVGRKELTNGRYRASPVFADGRIYLLGRDAGNVTVLKPGRELEVLSDNVLPDIFTASPVPSQGRIYLRGFKTLYAISEGGK